MVKQPPRAMTLEELAAASGLSVGLLSAVERGQQTTTRTLERIAQALGVRVTDLLTDERAHGDGSPTIHGSAKTGRSSARTRGKGCERGGNRATADDSSTQGGGGADQGEDGRPDALNIRKDGKS